MFSIDVGEGTFHLKETKGTFNNILNKIILFFLNQNKFIKSCVFDEA